MNSAILGKGSLRLSQAAGYAFRVVAVLAERPKEVLSIKRLAEREKLPRPFVSKIIRGLVKAGLLQARSGPAGGVSLARDPGRISLLDVAEACEGGFARRQCVYYSERLCPGSDCPVWCHLRRIEEELMNRLREVSVAKLAEDLRRHPNWGGGLA